MKKLFYLLLLVFPLFAISCTDSDEEEYEESENIGSVAGTWAFSSNSANVETSGSYSIIVNPLLQVALQNYAASNEPSYYSFSDDGQFEAYVLQNEEAVLSGSGTYTLVDNILTLTYADTSQAEEFEVITADGSTLKIRKDYSSSMLYWGAGILGEYAGMTLSKATSTLTYVIQ